MDTGEICATVEEVIRKYNGMVSRVAFHYVKNKEDAEDIAQEAYIKWMTKRPPFREAEGEKAWLIRVTVNLSKNHLRSAWRRKTLPMDAPPAGGDQELPDGEVLAAVLSLPAAYRVVVYLYYYEGYSSAEVAAILKRNPQTVRTQLARARGLLKTKLGDDGHG